MSPRMYCWIVGHNWVRQTSPDGTAQWQECIRCDKVRTTMPGFGAQGWF